MKNIIKYSALMTMLLSHYAMAQGQAPTGNINMQTCSSQNGFLVCQFGVGPATNPNLNSDLQAINGNQQIDLNALNINNSTIQTPQVNGSSSSTISNPFLFCSGGRPRRYNPLRPIYDTICPAGQFSPQQITKQVIQTQSSMNSQIINNTPAPSPVRDIANNINNSTTNTVNTANNTMINSTTQISNGQISQANQTIRSGAQQTAGEAIGSTQQIAQQTQQAAQEQVNQVVSNTQQLNAQIITANGSINTQIIGNNSINTGLTNVANNTNNGMSNSTTQVANGNLGQAGQTLNRTSSNNQTNINSQILISILPQ